MTARYYVLSGCGRPVFLEEEDGEAYPFDSLKSAHDAAEQSSWARTYGYVVLEWEGADLVRVHDSDEIDQ